MAQLANLSVEKRVRKGKEECKKLRVEGYVPGVFYNAAGENIPVKVKDVPLNQMYQKVGKARVFDLIIEDGSKLPSLIWDLQYHPVKSKITHVDFFGVDLEKEVKVFVAVEVTGKAKGIVEGGKLEIFRDTLEVSCKPLDIPESIVIDVTEMDINDHKSIDEIEAPQGVEFIFDDKFAVVGVVMPQAIVDDEEEEGEEGEEAAEEASEEAES